MPPDLMNTANKPFINLLYTEKFRVFLPQTMLRPALFVLVAMAAVASSIDVARLRRAVLYPDEDYDNADNEAAKADAAKKAKGPTATAEEKDAAQLGSPVPNATQHMEEWPTCRKLKVVPGGEGKFAAIAHKECRAQAVDDLAAVKNCFQNKCFLALNGNAPARDGTFRRRRT